MSPFKRGMSTSRIVMAVVVVVILVAAAVFVAVQKPAPTTTTSSSSSSTVSYSSSSSSTSASSSSMQTLANFGPTNKSVLVDDSVTGTPDCLDPASAYYLAELNVFNSVFQALDSFVGPNSTNGVVVPALAQSYTVNNNENYTFNIRPGVTFSNGHAVNASVVWFSYVRNMVMNQGIVFINFDYLTEPSNTFSATGLGLPWGLLNAVQSATGLPVTTNHTLAAKVLDNMLSNFHPDNATIQKVMSYPDQAYVVTGPMTFGINTLKPYSSSFFLADIAQWWGDILDPAYIDAHGGVQTNSVDSYFSSNGGPGTGPYYIASVGTGFSTVVLKENPTYWGQNVANLPPVLRPAHIPVIVINFNPTANTQREAFDTNQAQLSYSDLSVIGQSWSGYNYKQYSNFNGVLDNFGPGPNTLYYYLNPQRYPTNNTNFRFAVVNAINYTEFLKEGYTFNGTAYGQIFLGPLSQPWGKYYDPSNLPMYPDNDTIAIHYMNLAGQQEHFSLTLPNGTVIGDPKAPPLPPIQLVVEAPVTTVNQVMDSIIQSSLAQIGLSIAVQTETPSVMATYTTGQSAPNIMWGGWGPDWPDPVLQELDALLTPAVAPTSFMNVTSINNLLSSLAFQTNQTIYLQGIAQIYNFTRGYAPAIYTPNFDNYVLKQPYLQGMVYSPYTTVEGMYWYNTLYYVPCTTYLCNG